MGSNYFRQLLVFPIALCKIFLKVTFIVCSIYFLAVLVGKNNNPDTDSNAPLIESQIPAFYFSLLPQWYDSRLCLIAPSQAKSTGIKWMRQGMDIVQWNSIQSGISLLSSPGKYPETESLRYIEQLDQLKQEVANLQVKLRNDTNALSSLLILQSNLNNIEGLPLRARLPVLYFWGSNNSFHKAVFEGIFKPGNNIVLNFSTAFKLSMILSVFTFLFSVLGGTGLALLYINRSEKVKKILNVFMQLLYIFPVFCLAIFAVQFFTSPYYSPMLNWFPGPGSFLMLSNDVTFFVLLFSQSAYLILPALIVSIPLSAGVALRWIGGMEQEKHKVYVQVLRSKGLNRGQIYSRHILRNVAIPMVVYFAMLFPALMGGIVLIENIFAIGGLGRLTFQSVMNRDLGLLLIIVSFVALFNIVFNKIGLYCMKYVDPRLKLI